MHAISGGAGQGTSITVHLPLCPAPQGVRSEPESRSSGRGSARVLVVDDNEDAADTCGTLLQMSGYEVRVAYHPDTALEAMEDFHPEIAILDIGLPGMNGYQLARAMHTGC